MSEAVSRRARFAPPATVALATGGPLLLRRMRREFEDRGGLTKATTAGMYAAYLAHAALFTEAVRRGVGAGPKDGRRAWPPRALGTVGALGGAALCVAGMGRFRGASQVSGTVQGPLVETGAYRLNRNPQYTGYLLVLAGTALAARSGGALALAGAAAGVYGWWVPVEEQALEAAFGPEYTRYRARTRRWL